MVKNHLKEHVVRILEEELEIIHLRFENITPALHIIDPRSKNESILDQALV